MDYRVTTADMRGGKIRLPASKSISNRLLVMDALSGKKGRITGLAECGDTDAMLRVLRQVAAAKDGSGRVSVDVGDAGTVMRFITAYLSMQEGLQAVVDGSRRMRCRPVGELVDALRQCGAQISYAANPGYAPLIIDGRKLKSESPVEIGGNVSSQFVSALMMIAPYMEGGLELRMASEPVSRPYLEMTAALMRRLGVCVEFSERRIKVGEGEYGCLDIAVESDWSAAGFWYEIKALFPEMPVALLGLERESMQGDRLAACYFGKLGVTTRFDGGCAVLGYDRTAVVPRLDLDLSGEPDLVQALAVAACLRGIPFNISGIATLRIKETDRIAALESELAKMGFAIETGDSWLRWNGKRRNAETPLRISTFGDHRMAMAFAPAASVFPGLIIENAEVVGKSYPGYWKNLAEAGFNLEELK